MIQLCSRCHKRVPVIYITKIEGNVTKNEGLCLVCAKELGIPQVKDIMDKMGISDDDLENMEDQMSSLIPEENTGDDKNNESESRTPSIDFGKLFGGLPLFGPQENGERKKERSAEGAKKGQDTKKERKYISTYCRDLTDFARNGKLDRIVGRERETERIIQILTRRQKNNPCLIGEPGVGKTAIAEALAQRIADGNVPYKLLGKEVQLVDMTSLVAGTQFRGQFEARMKGLIDEVRSLGNIILVIDEVHNIVGVGDAEGSMNAANILKPALSRGEIQLIGATTLTEYRKYIEKDSALERRFQPIIVEEPSIAESKKIIAGIKKYYEGYHGVKIPDAMIDRIVELSERYITDRFLPDKAIDLMDEACSYVAMHSPVIGEVSVLRKKYERLKTDLVSAEETQINSSDEELQSKKYEKIAQIKAEQLKTEEELNKLTPELDNISLNVGAIAQVIEVWTGISAGTISANEFERLNGLSERLKKRVIGQDDAVDAVARAIKRNRTGVSYKRKPASFIFAGPTGVGKTELVKVLAEDLFDKPDALIRLDMSEFMEKHSVSRLLGSPPGYVGYDDAGQLTEKIRRKPYSVVLFDEIEKAHPDVLNVLLQILDDGRVTDAHGKEVNFEDTIIVMTTNAGSSNGSNPVGFESSVTQIAKARTEKALSEFLRPEFLNRVDEIITFRQLDKKDFGQIAGIMMGDLRKSMNAKGIDILYSDDVLSFIAENSYSEKFGARNMRRYISTNIEDPAAELIISNYDKHITLMTVTVKDGKLFIDIK